LTDNLRGAARQDFNTKITKDTKTTKNVLSAQRSIDSSGFAANVALSSAPW
jgi:hypothetical protein